MVPSHKIRDMYETTGKRQILMCFSVSGKTLRRGKEFIDWNKWLKIFKDTHKNLNKSDKEKKLFHGSNFLDITCPLLE